MPNNYATRKLEAAVNLLVICLLGIIFDFEDGEGRGYSS
jgi:hypothetical protein